MNWDYSEKNDVYENQFYEMLFSIKKCPGAILGAPSLKKLSVFLGGYEYASMGMRAYRLHFEKDFQPYVFNLMKQTTLPFSSRRWDNLIAEGRSDEEAFEYFYTVLEGFLSCNNLCEKFADKL